MRDYWRDPVRTILTLFGIVLGAASIVFLASALTAAAASLKRMNQQANGADVSRLQAKPLPPTSAQTARELSQHDAQVIAQVEQLPADHIADSSRRMHIEGSIAGHRMWVGAQSGGSEWARLAGLELLHGRWLQPAEDNERIAMIGFDVWKRGFGGKWPLADEHIVLHGRVPLKVVGVFKSRPPLGGGGGDGTWMFDRKVYVSTTTFKRAIDAADNVEEVVFRHPKRPSMPAPDLTAIALRLTPLVERLHLGAHNFQFAVLSKRHQTEDLIVLGLGAILFACGLVAMTVGGLNVMNAQLVLLGEKTREYGIRRALGASAWSLQRDVLLQALLLTTLGGTAGVVLGLGAAFALSRVLAAVFGEWAFVMLPWSVIVALVSAAIVGLLAGLGPARRAGRLLPSECLRAT